MQGSLRTGRASQIIRQAAMPEFPCSLPKKQVLSAKNHLHSRCSAVFLKFFVFSLLKSKRLLTIQVLLL
jgi:hypothetical protein